MNQYTTWLVGEFCERFYLEMFVLTSPYFVFDLLQRPTAMFAAPPQDPLFLSDYVYDHHSDVHVIKSCQHERGRGLLAVAGESRVEVLLRVSRYFNLQGS
jgi:hypothetical protein